MTETDHETRSPYWSSTTKLVIGLTLVTIVGALLVRFQNIIGPLILTFILSYVLHPVAAFIVDRTKLSWRGSVNLIFLVLLVAIISFTTATGVAVVNQLQSLVRLVQNFIGDLPQLAETMTTQVYVIPVINYTLDVGQIISQLNIDLLALSQQVLGLIQPMLGQAGAPCSGTSAG